MSDPRTTARITEALETGQFLSTGGIASWLGVGRAQVLEAFDEIQAAGIKVMRIRGLEGGIQLLTRRLPKSGIELKRAGSGFVGKRIVRKAA